MAENPLETCKQPAGVPEPDSRIEAEAHSDSGLATETISDGAAQEPLAGEVAAEPKKAWKHKRLVIVLACVAGALIIAGAVLFALLGGSLSPVKIQSAVYGKTVDQLTSTEPGSEVLFVKYKVNGDSAESKDFDAVRLRKSDGSTVRPGVLGSMSSGDEGKSLTAYFSVTDAEIAAGFSFEVDDYPPVPLGGMLKAQDSNGK